MIATKIQNKKYVIEITYGNYLQSVGGVDKCILSEQNILLEQGISIICLFDVLHYVKRKQNHHHNFWGVIIDGKFEGIFSTECIISDLSALNRSQLQSVIVHHLMNLDLGEVGKILESTNSNILFFVHDYYMLCNQTNLMVGDHTCDYTRDYIERCNNCKWGKETLYRVANIKRLLEKHINRIKFICPSEISKSIFIKTYSEYRERVLIIPHLTYKKIYKKHGSSEKIAYIGMPHEKKGYGLWVKIINSCTAYQYFQLGRKTETIKNIKYKSVKFTTKDLNPMPRALLENDIGVVLLWSMCPETYSFTYFESFQANCFVITNKLSGNIADQVKANGNGIVLNQIVRITSR